MRRTLLIVSCTLALAVGVNSAVRAQFTPIVQPDAWYLSATTMLPTPDTFPASSLTDGLFTVNLSAGADQYRQAPGSGWSTWNSPPWVEPTPTDVFYFPDVTSLTMTFSNPVNIFGFEGQPKPFAVHDMSAIFYMGGSQVGNITLPVDGNSGARLFAAQGTWFDQVVFSSDTEFAIGRVRYGNEPDVVPEAGTLASFGSMAGFGLLWLRRRLSA